MKRSNVLLTIIAVSAGLLIPYCTQNSPVAGGASDTEVSARVSGVATDMFGKPVAGASVQLRTKDFLPEQDTVTQMPGKYTKADCSTDSEGYFLLDSLGAGIYNLAIVSGDSVGTIRECIVGDKQSVSVEPVLMPFGLVIGWLQLPYVIPEILARAKVELIGSENKVHPDSMGFFQFPLPEGMHRLKMSVDSSFFDKVTIDVEVVPSQVKNIGMIRLNMLPPPPPPCIDGACDSAVLRKFLDDAGHGDISVGDVTTWINGRIESLNLRGLDIRIPLEPLGLLNTVRKLDLGKTGTADSCRFIISMWNLQEVYLDSNNITGISHSFEGAYRIKVLDLSDNRLTMLPEKINYLMPDQKLDLSGNELCYLPPPLAGWADTWNPGWKETQRCP